MKKLYILLVMAMWVTVGYALYWPIVYGSYEEQKITSNFGEYRSTGTHHFHDGVDLEPYAGTVLGTWVWGVENEYIWQISESGHYLKTWWHDYHHINPENGLSPNDPVDPTCQLGEIDYSGDPPHLHWNARTLACTPPSTATHPIHPYQNIWYRLDPLMWDFYNPIIHDVIFTDDGDYQTTHAPNQLPANTNIDIVVKATDWHPHHGTGGYNDNNGVYMVGYNIDAPPTQFNIKFDYNETIGDWNLNCVYDNIHSSTSQYWYVVTNTMTQNGYWNTGSPGAHQV
ncbi:hypothetical protein KAX97_07215 [candidate division WOR-3 bacterium]|nr:hypothetical protein [candidate division WOR-3 bacterium]